MSTKTTSAPAHPPARMSRLRAPSVRPGNELADFVAEAYTYDARRFVEEVVLRPEFVGFVCFLGEDPSRWTGDLPEPWMIVPGVIVVAATGHLYRATGGDKINGARELVLIFTPEGVQK